MHVAAALFAAITVNGSVQFWERACDGAGACGLPVATSERIEVSGTIDAPSVLPDFSTIVRQQVTQEAQEKVDEKTEEVKERVRDRLRGLLER